MAASSGKGIQDLIDAMTKDLYAQGQAQAALGPSQLGSSAGSSSQIQGGLTMGGLQAQIGTLMGMLGKPLTSEEAAEIDNLIAEHKSQIKAMKLVVFKNLASEMRQFVINAVSWKDALTEINGVKVDKSDRLKELEAKRDLHKNYIGSGYSGHSSGLSMFTQSSLDLGSFYNMIGLPEGVTADDLKVAHLEATLEEEMIDG